MAKVFKCECWYINNTYCMLTSIFYSVLWHHLKENKISSSAISPRKMTVIENDPSWSSTWELLIVSLLVFFGPVASSLEVELESDPTVTLDSCLSLTIFLVKTKSRNLYITHHHYCSCWCSQPPADVQSPRSWPDLAFNPLQWPWSKCHTGLCSSCVTPPSCLRTLTAVEVSELLTEAASMASTDRSSLNIRLLII